MNPFNVCSLLDELYSEDAKKLFLFLINEYWEIPKKYIARASKKTGMSIEETIAAKREIKNKGLIDENGFTDKTKLSIHGSDR